ncbi:MAG TPA: hypothetical protein VF335_05190 [Chitinivibrionales bacterium]
MRIFRNIPVVLILTVFFFGCGEKRETREIKHENGKLKEKYYVIKNARGAYENDGPAMSWYPSGRKKMEWVYKHDTFDGPFIAWYQSGLKAGVGAFKEGAYDGLVKMWYENGTMESEAVFKNGKIVPGSEKTWDENGNPKQPK